MTEIETASVLPCVFACLTMPCRNLSSPVPPSPACHAQPIRATPRTAVPSLALPGLFQYPPPLGQLPRKPAPPQLVERNQPGLVKFRCTFTNALNLGV